MPARRALVVSSNREIDAHDTGLGHPERAARNRAAWEGLRSAGLADAIVEVAPRPAELEELALVHEPGYLDWIESISAAGGGRIDADTVASAGSWDTALSAAGAGLASMEALERGEGQAGLVLVRPPGHHAGTQQAMGFCLLNNVAIAAARLVERGQRVVILDWDVHHGNGTQEIFWDDPNVLFISLHQRGLYPGTGLVAETGGVDAPGTTLNIPLPAGTTGDALRAAFDELVAPAIESFGADWLLVSAGFDGHRDDAISGWMLSAGDYADVARRCGELSVPSGRTLMFLEGGYDLSALRMSVGAVAAALLDEPYRPEPSSEGSIGISDVAEIIQWHQQRR